eukprot:NODE_127_length_17034_cov_0.369590.p8 type:complete len:234 gc:universal NODE_127_length_17034_cov_0.369590:11103-10402(-)
MLIALLAVFGLFKRAEEEKFPGTTDELVHPREGWLAPSNSQWEDADKSFSKEKDENSKMLFNMATRDLTNFESMKKYYKKSFEISTFNLEFAMQNDKAWAVNALYYCSIYARDPRICASIVYAFGRFDAEFTQNEVYFKVMIEMFEHFRNLPIQIKSLLKDFARVFFVERPQSYEEQINAIDKLARMNEYTISERILNGLNPDFKDKFATQYFNTAEVRAYYPPKLTQEAISE